MTRTNWVHHVDYHKDGWISIDRRGQSERIYRPTQASMKRLLQATLEWTHYPAGNSDIQSRAMAPMRRF